MSLKITCDVTFICADSSTISGGTRKISIAPPVSPNYVTNKASFATTGVLTNTWFQVVGYGGAINPFSVAWYPIVAIWDIYSLYNDLNVRTIRLSVKWTDNHVRYIDIAIGSTNNTDIRRNYSIGGFSYIIDGVTKISNFGSITGSAVGYQDESGGRYRGFAHGTTIPWWIIDNNGNECFGRYQFYTSYLEPKSGQSSPSLSEDSITAVPTSSNPALNTAFNEWLAGLVPEDIDDDDPYPDPDDPDDNDSDDPQPDPLPGISVVGSGFATIFTPSLAQLRNLSGLFWNETIFDFFQNLVENISDMFLSLAMVPFSVPAGRTVSVTWLGIDTAVSLTLAAQQFIEFNMGNINLGGDSRIWRSESALDFSPFSQLGIYLPFIGFRDLDIDDCRDKVMNLKYRIDILSGECVAIISVGGAVLYQFAGNCLTQIPITNEGMQALVADAVQVGLSIAAVSSSGGAASAEIAGETGTSLADRIKEFRSNVANSAAGRQLASTTANAVIGGKPMYGKTGSVSGAGGLLAVRQPYLYLKTPRSAIPNYYRRYCGYPCNKTGKLGSFTGYTVVEDIRLNNLVATSAEVSEIYDLLKGGVII